MKHTKAHLAGIAHIQAVANKMLHASAHLMPTHRRLERGVWAQLKVLLTTSARTSLTLDGLNRIQAQEDMPEPEEPSVDEQADVEHSARLATPPLVSEIDGEAPPVKDGSRQGSPSGHRRSQSVHRLRLLDPECDGDAEERESLWGIAQRLVTPMSIRTMAVALGIELHPPGDEYHLLPFAVAALRAPLPPGWREVYRRREVVYEKVSTDQFSRVHPFFDSFKQLVKLQRMRSGPRYPHKQAPLLTAAERWMQFVDNRGKVYFYDFSSGTRAISLQRLVEHLLEQVPHARPIVTSKKPPKATQKRQHEMSPEEAAAAAVLAVASKREAPGAARFASVVETASTSMAKAMANDESSREQRNALVDHLRSLYEPTVAMSVVHEPRPLPRTLLVALAYSLRLEFDADCVFLADIAISMPPPAGWIRVEPASRQESAYWYNALHGCSQHQHPVDTFIRDQLKQIRQPTVKKNETGSHRRSLRPPFLREDALRSAADNIGNISTSSSKSGTHGRRRRSI